MKIELKNIRHSETLSEETNAFTANVYIDGKFAAYARNDGRGGNTDIRPKDAMDWDLIKKAEQYCSTLPEREVDFGNGTHSFKMDLETVIDDLLEQHLDKKHRQKFERKLEKAMSNQIVYGTPGGDEFAAIVFKSPLAEVLKHPKGPQSIMEAIQRDIIPKLREGEKILNTNIPGIILMDAGLAVGQYVRPVARRVQKQGRTKSNRKGI